MGFVTETWTQYGNEPEYQYIKANLDTVGYNILIQSRENWKGGGIAVTYKSHLQEKNLSFNEYTSFETLTINLNISTKSYLFSVIYRTPYSTKQLITMLTFLEEFPDHISSLFRSSKNIIILGDFNIPWNKSEHPDTTSMQENYGHAWPETTYRHTNTQMWKYPWLAHKQQPRYHTGHHKQGLPISPLHHWVEISSQPKSLWKKNKHQEET